MGVGLELTGGVGPVVDGVHAASEARLLPAKARPARLRMAARRDIFLLSSQLGKVVLCIVFLFFRA